MKQSQHIPPPRGRMRYNNNRNNYTQQRVNNQRKQTQNQSRHNSHRNVGISFTAVQLIH